MKIIEIQNCDICRSLDSQILGKPKFTNETPDILKSVNIDIVRCKKCGFYYINPMIYFDEEDIINLYGNQYFQEEKLTGRWIRKRSLDRIRRLNKLEYYRENKVLKFLDLGCGEGYMLEEASSRGYEVHGVDFTDNLIDCVKDRKNISFKKGTLMEIKYPANYFDAIYVDSVLEHVQSPIELMSEINRILTKGGVLYIAIPNEGSLDIKFRGMISRIKNPGVSVNLNPLQNPYHVVGFTPEVISKIARETEFEVLDIRTYGGVDEIMKRKWKLNIRALFIHLFLMPIYLTGLVLNKGHYIEAYLKKPQ